MLDLTTLPSCILLFFFIMSSSSCEIAKFEIYIFMPISSVFRPGRVMGKCIVTEKAPRAFFGVSKYSLSSPKNLINAQGAIAETPGT